MLPHPANGWANSQVTYRHLIRPVVAFVRDRGPVSEDRVHELISTTAAGDLSFASPTRNRAEAARLALNLLVDDIDELSLADSIVSVSSTSSGIVGATVVHSALFGEWTIPTADVLEADREASKRQRVLREWVGRHLFATVWRDGIRKYGDTEIDWMADQIQRFGYAGPKIVRDADGDTIIDGGLRAAALARLGLPVTDHSEAKSFENDMHRLAYILAVHTMPGSRTRVPASLRDAILKEVVPRNAGLLRNKSGALMEPTLDEWADITGRDFASRPPTPQPTPTPTESDNTTESRTSVTQVVDQILTDRILAVMDENEWVGYNAVYERLHTSGAASERTSRTMRDMVDDNRLEKRYAADGKTVEFRPRVISLPKVKPSAEGRPELPSHFPTSGKEAAIYILIEVFPGKWIAGGDLDNQATLLLRREKKQRAAYLLGDPERGTLLWSTKGEPWRIERKMDGNKLWLRAVKE